MSFTINSPELPAVLERSVTVHQRIFKDLRRKGDMFSSVKDAKKSVLENSPINIQGS
jgi:hypothetical protein